MKQGEHIFILFSNGKSVVDKRYNGKMKTYMSIESHIKNRGKRYGEELVEYVPVVEACWEDITKPGQVTCGGNPFYACGRCGAPYGSFELFPSAKYCKECGARMKGVRF
jgi:hypothetical protein